MANCGLNNLRISRTIKRELRKATSRLNGATENEISEFFRELAISVYNKESVSAQKIFKLMADMSRNDYGRESEIYKSVIDLYDIAKIAGQEQRIYAPSDIAPHTAQSIMAEALVNLTAPGGVVLPGVVQDSIKEKTAEEKQKSASKKVSTVTGNDGIGTGNGDEDADVLNDDGATDTPDEEVGNALPASKPLVIQLYEPSERPKTIGDITNTIFKDVPLFQEYVINSFKQVFYDNFIKLKGDNPDGLITNPDEITKAVEKHYQDILENSKIKPEDRDLRLAMDQLVKGERSNMAEYIIADTLGSYGYMGMYEREYMKGIDFSSGVVKSDTIALDFTTNDSTRYSSEAGTTELTKMHLNNTPRLELTTRGEVMTEQGASILNDLEELGKTVNTFNERKKVLNDIISGKDEVTANKLTDSQLTDIKQLYKDFFSGEAAKMKKILVQSTTNPYLSYNEVSNLFEVIAKLGHVPASIHDKRTVLKKIVEEGDTGAVLGLSESELNAIRSIYYRFFASDNYETYDRGVVTNNISMEGFVRKNNLKEDEGLAMMVNSVFMTLSSNADKSNMYVDNGETKTTEGSLKSTLNELHSDFNKSITNSERSTDMNKVVKNKIADKISIIKSDNDAHAFGIKIGNNTFFVNKRSLKQGSEGGLVFDIDTAASAKLAEVSTVMSALSGVSLGQFFNRSDIESYMLSNTSESSRELGNLSFPNIIANTAFMIAVNTPSNFDILKGMGYTDMLVKAGETTKDVNAMDYPMRENIGGVFQAISKNIDNQHSADALSTYVNLEKNGLSMRSVRSRYQDTGKMIEEYHENIVNETGLPTAEAIEKAKATEYMANNPLVDGTLSFMRLITKDGAKKDKSIKTTKGFVDQEHYKFFIENGFLQGAAKTGYESMLMQPLVYSDRSSKDMVQIGFNGGREYILPTVEEDGKVFFHESKLIERTYQAYRTELTAQEASIMRSWRNYFESKGDKNEIATINKAESLNDMLPLIHKQTYKEVSESIHLTANLEYMRTSEGPQVTIQPVLLDQINTVKNDPETFKAYIAHEKEAFLNHVENSGYLQENHELDSRSEEILSDIFNTTDKEVLKSHLLSAFFYNQNVVGTAISNLTMGSDFLYKSPRYKDVIVPGTEFNAKEYLYTDKNGKDVIGDPTEFKVSTSDGIYKMKGAKKTKAIKQKLKFLSWNSNTSGMVLDKYKRASSLNSILQRPRIVKDSHTEFSDIYNTMLEKYNNDTVKAEEEAIAIYNKGAEKGAYLGQYSNVALLKDPEWERQLLGSFKTAGGDPYDAAFLTHPLYTYLMHNSLGGIYSGYSKIGTPVKALTFEVGSKKAFARLQKKAEFDIFNNEILINHGSPELERLLKKLNTQISFGNTETGDGTVAVNVPEVDLDGIPVIDPSTGEEVIISKRFKNMDELWNHFNGPFNEDSWRQVAFVIGQNPHIRNSYIQGMGFVSGEKVGNTGVNSPETILGKGDAPIIYTRRDNRFHGVILNADHNPDTTGDHPNKISFVTQAYNSAAFSGDTKEIHNILSNTLASKTDVEIDMENITLLNDTIKALNADLADVRNEIPSNIVGEQAKELIKSKLIEKLGNVDTVNALEEYGVNLTTPADTSTFLYLEPVKSFTTDLSRQVTVLGDTQYFKTALSNHIKNIILKNSTDRDLNSINSELLSDTKTKDSPGSDPGIKLLIDTVHAGWLSYLSKGFVKAKLAGGQYVAAPAYDLIKLYTLNNGARVDAKFWQDTMLNEPYADFGLESYEEFKTIKDDAYVKTYSADGTERVSKGKVFKADWINAAEEYVNASLEEGATDIDRDNAIKDFLDKQFAPDEDMGDNADIILDSYTVSDTPVKRKINDINEIDSLFYGTRFLATNTEDGTSETVNKLQAKRLFEEGEKIEYIELPSSTDDMHLKTNIFTDEDGVNALHTNEYRTLSFITNGKVINSSKDPVPPKVFELLNKLKGDTDVEFNISFSDYEDALQTIKDVSESTMTSTEKSALELVKSVANSMSKILKQVKGDTRVKALFNRTKSEYNQMFTKKKWKLQKAEFIMPMVHATAFGMKQGDSLADFAGSHLTKGKNESDEDFAKRVNTHSKNKFLARINEDESILSFLKYGPNSKIPIDRMLKIKPEVINNIKLGLREAIDEFAMHEDIVYQLEDLQKTLDSGDVSLYKSSIIDTRDAIRERVAQDRADNFPKTFDLFTGRIPGDAKSSNLVGTIKGFVHSTRNSSYGPFEANLITGQDHDVDKTNTIVRSVDKYGVAYNYEQFCTADMEAIDTHFDVKLAELLKGKEESEAKSIIKEHNDNVDLAKRLIREGTATESENEYAKEATSYMNIDKSKFYENLNEKLIKSGEKISAKYSKLFLDKVNTFETKEEAQQFQKETIIKRDLLIKKTSEKIIKAEHEYFSQASNNLILDKLIDIYAHPKNAVEANSEMGMSTIQAFAKEQEKLKAAAPLAPGSKYFGNKVSPMNPAAIPIYEIENAAGKDGIAVFAAALKTYSAIFTAWNTSEDSQTEFPNIFSDLNLVDSKVNKASFSKTGLKLQANREEKLQKLYLNSIITDPTIEIRPEEKAIIKAYLDPELDNVVEYETATGTGEIILNKKPMLIHYTTPTGRYIDGKAEYKPVIRVSTTVGNTGRPMSNKLKGIFVKSGVKLTSNGEKTNITEAQVNELIDNIYEASWGEEEVAVSLRELLNAATDNAKELILKKIGATATTSGMISGMLMMGFKLQDSLEYVNSPAILEAISTLEKNSNMESDSVGPRDLEKYADSILNSKKYNTARESLVKNLSKLNDIGKSEMLLNMNFDPIIQLKKITRMAAEIKSVSDVLKVNTGYATKTFDLLRYLHNAESVVNKIYREAGYNVEESFDGKSAADTGIVDPKKVKYHAFNLMDFVADGPVGETTRKFHIDLFNTVKTAVNVPLMLEKNKHFFGYLKGLSLGIKGVNSLSAYSPGIATILDRIYKSKLKGDKVALNYDFSVSNDMHSEINNFYYSAQIEEYFKHVCKDKPVTVDSMDFNLGLAEDRSKFFNAMSEFVDRLKAKEADLDESQRNGFLKAVYQVAEINNVTGETYHVIKTRDLNKMPTAQLDMIKAEFNRLDDNVKNALFYYSLMVDRGSRSKMSFAQAIGFDLFKDYSRYSQVLSEDPKFLDKFNEDNLSLETLALSCPTLLHSVSDGTNGYDFSSLDLSKAVKDSTLFRSRDTNKVYKVFDKKLPDVEDKKTGEIIKNRVMSVPVEIVPKYNRYTIGLTSSLQEGTLTNFNGYDSENVMKAGYTLGHPMKIGVDVTAQVTEYDYAQNKFMCFRDNSEVPEYVSQETLIKHNPGYEVKYNFIRRSTNRDSYIKSTLKGQLGDVLDLSKVVKLGTKNAKTLNNKQKSLIENAIRSNKTIELAVGTSPISKLIYDYVNERVLGKYTLKGNFLVDSNVPIDLGSSLIDIAKQSGNKVILPADMFFKFTKYLEKDIKTQAEANADRKEGRQVSAYIEDGGKRIIMNIGFFESIKDNAIVTLDDMLTEDYIRESARAFMFSKDVRFSNFLKSYYSMYSLDRTNANDVENIRKIAKLFVEEAEFVYNEKALTEVVTNTTWLSDSKNSRNKSVAGVLFRYKSIMDYIANLKANDYNYESDMEFVFNDDMENKLFNVKSSTNSVLHKSFKNKINVNLSGESNIDIFHQNFGTMFGMDTKTPNQSDYPIEVHQEVLDKVLGAKGISSMSIPTKLRNDLSKAIASYSTSKVVIVEGTYKDGRNITWESSKGGDTVFENDNTNIVMEVLNEINNSKNTNNADIYLYDSKSKINRLLKVNRSGKSYPVNSDKIAPIGDISIISTSDSVDPKNAFNDLKSMYSNTVFSESLDYGEWRKAGTDYANKYYSELVDNSDGLKDVSNFIKYKISEVMKEYNGALNNIKNNSTKSLTEEEIQELAKEPVKVLSEKLKGLKNLRLKIDTEKSNGIKTQEESNTQLSFEFHTGNLSEGFKLKSKVAGSKVMNFVYDRILEAYPNSRIISSEEINFEFGTVASKSFGFVTDDGTLVINKDKASLDTPMHELGGHVYMTYLKDNEPELYNSIIERCLQMPETDSIRKEYSHLTSDEAVAREVFAHYLGLESQCLIEPAMANDWVAVKDLVRTSKKTFWQQIKEFIGNILGINFELDGVDFELGHDDSLKTIVQKISADILYNKGSMINQGNKGDRKNTITDYLTKDDLDTALKDNLSIDDIEHSLTAQGYIRKVCM